jgi:ribose transport system substrate-binding protein
MLGKDGGLRRLLVPVGVAAVGAVLAACGRPPEAKAPARPRIALVMKSLANEFFLTMETGARAHQAKDPHRYELLANGIKDELDASAQAGLVEQMIAQKVDAIVLAPADSKALVAACKRAVEAGIVVVNIDNRLDAAALAERGLRIPFVGPDNRKGARQVGDYLAGKLQKGDAVAIIEGVPTTFNAQQRKLGFEDAIAAAGLRLVASQSGDWEMAKANQVAAAILGEHPQLKALLCANDNMALGAVAARKAAGKEEAVRIVGFDNIRAVAELVKAGKVVATADQHAGELAVFGIEHALETLAKKSPPADRETPVDLVTAETLRSRPRS